MKVYLLMLEPIEERYSIQWLAWFQEVFKDKNIPFEIILGDHVNSKLSGKYFLDPVNTNIWKLTQLTNLLKQIDDIQDDDVIFFADLWNPGLEVLPYIRNLTGKHFKIAGYLHAGTYDPWDLTTQTGMTSWAAPLEESWFKSSDIIFVATDFHKKLILKSRAVDPDKIQVVGFPLDIQNLRLRYPGTINKDSEYVVFTGRKTVEKGYPIIQELIQAGYPVINSLDASRSKEDYYNLLLGSSGVISPCLQETFGIGVVEGMALGCVPIVPDRLSYQETVPKEYRYSNESEIGTRIQECFKTSKEDRRAIQEYVCRHQYQEVIGKIIKILQDHI